MKIVITGGLGFIFSHVTEHFLEKGWHVHVIDNCSEGSHPELLGEWKMKYGERFIFSKEDASFSPVIKTITLSRPDYIIHAAAISDVDYSIKQPMKTIMANNNATMNVFEAARGCKNLKKLLYVSTDEVYGECDHPKTEDELIWPRNPYALSKAFGSLVRIAYDNTFPELRNKTVETRFCNVFGPRQDARKIIPAITGALNGGKPVILHNGGEGFRQWIYVKDIPPVIELLLENGHRIYNVTSGIGWSVKYILIAVEEAIRRRIPTIPGKRSGMDMRYEMNGARLRDEFGWEPKYRPSDALASLVKGTPL